MQRKESAELGQKPISKLLIGQAVPASIGILVMSLNILIDTIFVGNWIGPIAIAAINVVLPVSFYCRTRDGDRNRRFFDHFPRPWCE